MAAARGEGNRNIGNGINVRPPPQLNRGDLNAILQAPVAQDLVVDWLSDLPEAKRSVAESVIWPKLK